MNSTDQNRRRVRIVVECMTDAEGIFERHEVTHTEAASENFNQSMGQCLARILDSLREDKSTWSDQIVMYTIEAMACSNDKESEGAFLKRVAEVYKGWDFSGSFSDFAIDILVNEKAAS